MFGRFFCKFSSSRNKILYKNTITIKSYKSQETQSNNKKDRSRSRMTQIICQLQHTNESYRPISKQPHTIKIRSQNDNCFSQQQAVNLDPFNEIFLTSLYFIAHFLSFISMTFFPLRKSTTFNSLKNIVLLISYAF